MSPNMEPAIAYLQNATAINEGGGKMIGGIRNSQVPNSQPARRSTVLASDHPA
jgi:hypothetical protein